jgi:hypothetical protein
MSMQLRILKSTPRGLPFISEEADRNPSALQDFHG